MRIIASCKRLLSSCPVVAILGARQVGKTTLARLVAPLLAGDETAGDEAPAVLDACRRGRMSHPTRGIPMAKAKISVTVDQSLLDACDKLAPKASRSEIVQLALARWLRDRRRRVLEDEIERYYASLDEDERAEDARWADAGARALAKTWK